MSEQNFGEISVSIEKLAEVYGIPVEKYVSSITGSTQSALFEELVAQKLNGERVVGKQLEWDVEAPHRELKKIEVRNVCNCPISFAPSTATGKGRFFDEEDFLNKLSKIDSYVICDLRKRLTEPVKLYEIPATLVKKLYCNGELNKDAKLGQSKFFERFSHEEYGLRP